MKLTLKQKLLMCDISIECGMKTTGTVEIYKEEVRTARSLKRRGLLHGNDDECGLTEAGLKWAIDYEKS